MVSIRMTGTIVYHGNKLVMIAKRNGKILEIKSEPDHPDLQCYFQLFKELLSREFNPFNKITIETINGESIANCITNHSKSLVFMPAIIPLICGKVIDLQNIPSYPAEKSIGSIWIPGSYALSSSPQGEREPENHVFTKDPGIHIEPIDF